MIKNVIFDFGQVLVRFEPSYMVGKYVSNKSDARLLEEVVFDRLYWDGLDAGAITDLEVIEACKTRVPQRLWSKVEEIYYNWIYNIPEIKGMRELIHTLKTQHGVGLYLLSNISLYFAEHAHEIGILKNFDKCVFSAVCGFTKPSREIFEHLCAECGILPEESIFIDDNEKNIKGASDFGLNTYFFDGECEKLRAHLDSFFK